MLFKKYRPIRGGDIVVATPNNETPMPTPSPECSLPIASTTSGPNSPTREPPKAPITSMNTTSIGNTG